MISLCKKCNEDTGSWYVPDFSKFVGAGVQVHREMVARDTENPDESLDIKEVEFSINKMRALLVTKQIVASLLALNPPTFAQKNPHLREFVLTRNAKGLPNNYRLYLTLFRGPLARFAGLGVQTNIETRQTVFLTELAHPPFAYVMTIDSEPLQPMGEITEWVNRDPDDTRDERLRLLLGFGHTAFPADYRSRARVLVERTAKA